MCTYIFRRRDVQRLHKGISKQTQSYQQTPIFYRGTEGNLVTGKDDVMTAWKQHFKALLNGEIRRTEECRTNQAKMQLVNTDCEKLLSREEVS